jgi:hypothetical protein
MGQDEIDAATSGFKQQTRAWISRMTNDRLCWTGEVFVSPRVLTTFSRVCGAPIPWIADVRADLDEQAPNGKYDSIVVYAPNGGGAPNCGGSPSASSNYATFAYVIPRGAAAWGDQYNDVYDAVIHEWMHGVIGFYESKPGVGPVPAIDSAATYGYSRDPTLGWKVFLGDVLNRKVKVGGALQGLGDPAWNYGPIRDAAPR